MCIFLILRVYFKIIQVNFLHYLVILILVPGNRTSNTKLNDYNNFHTLGRLVLPDSHTNVAQWLTIYVYYNSNNFISYCLLFFFVYKKNAYILCTYTQLHLHSRTLHHLGNFCTRFASFVYATQLSIDDDELE